MKIPDVKGLVSIARGVLDPKKGQPAEKAAGAGAQADRVELSSESQAVARITAERMDQKARSAQVAELKAALERGELKPDHKAVAEALVEEGLFDDLLTGK